MKVVQVIRTASILRVALVIAAFAAFPAAPNLAQRRRPAPPVTNLTDLINAMQFSADGRMLAIARGARDDYRVELWDTTTGKLIRTIRGFDGMIWSVSFTPDGRTLVTASGGTHQEKVAKKPGSRNGKHFTELKWWDPQTGDLKQRYELPNDDVIAVMALHSPDGRLLATAETRLEMRGAVFDGLSAGASGMPNRTFLLQESDLKLLDAATGELRTKLKDGFAGLQFPFFGGMSMDAYRPQRITPITFSADGKLIAAWGSSELRLWSSSGIEILKIKKFKGRLVTVAFSPDGKLVAGAVVETSFKNNQLNFKSELQVWDVATGSPRPAIQLNTPLVTSMIFGNDRQLLISGLQTREDRSHASMELADLEQGSLGKLIANDEGMVSSICLSPDGTIIAFQIDAATVKLVETRTWRTRFTLGTDEEASSDNASFRRFMVTVNSVSAVAFLADDKTVVGEIENGGIKLWDARTGEARKTFAVEAETGSMAAISADGLIAEVASDESVRLWRTGGEGSKTIPANNHKVSAIAVAAEGPVLAIGYENAVVLINTDSLATKQTLELKDVAALALAPDGRLLAVASRDGAIKIWDTDAGTVKSNVAAAGEITALQFAARDQTLAAGFKNGSVRVWNAAGGELTFEAKKHDGAVYAIAFSKDGKLMATGGDDRTAIIWEIETHKSRRTLKGHDLVISSLAFSPSGEVLAVGSGNASVVLWDVATGKLNRVMK